MVVVRANSSPMTTISADASPPVEWNTSTTTISAVTFANPAAQVGHAAFSQSGPSSGTVSVQQVADDAVGEQASLQAEPQASVLDPSQAGRDHLGHPGLFFPGEHR